VTLLLFSGGWKVRRTPPMVNSRRLVMFLGFESTTSETENLA
jgi:hypothetical protein